jgi:hypothetical protein
MRTVTRRSDAGRAIARSVLLICTLAAAACGNAASPPASSTEPAETAWDAIATSVGDDGLVTQEAALQAFEYVFDVDLPGVEIPAGERPPVLEGTLPLIWLAPYEDSLDPTIGAVIDAALDVPEDEETPAPALVGVPSAAGAGVDPAFASLEDQVAAAGGIATLGVHISDQSCTRAYYTDKTSTSGKKYEPIVQEELAKLEPKLGPLGIPVYVTTGIDTGDGPYAWATGQSPDCRKIPSTSCHMNIFPKAIARTAADEVQYHQVISHELIHCYQFSWQTQLRASWLTEGFAEFGTLDLHPGGYRAWLNVYFENHERPLFERTYDAAGFYMRLKTLGGHPWAQFRSAFAQETSDDSFTVLADELFDVLDDAWASGYLVDKSRGELWDEPEAPAGAGATPTLLSIENDSSETIDTVPYQSKLRYAAFTADVVSIAAAGGLHGRLSFDGQPDDELDTLEPTLYCNRPDGCMCPEGASPETELIPATSAVIALSGMADATVVEIHGFSMDELCADEPPIVSTSTAEPSVEAGEIDLGEVWSGEAIRIDESLWPGITMTRTANAEFTKAPSQDPDADKVWFYLSGGSMTLEITGSDAEHCSIDATGSLQLQASEYSYILFDRTDPTHVGYTATASADDGPELEARVTCPDRTYTYATGIEGDFLHVPEDLNASVADGLISGEYTSTETLASTWTWEIGRVE